MAEALPTRNDLFRIGAAEVFLRSASRDPGLRISPEAVFTEGTDANILMAASAAMGDESLRHLAARMAALYLDSAEGEDLDRLVADRFSPTVVRKSATSAVVPLLLTRIDTTSALTLLVGHKVRTASGVEYALLSPASFSPGIPTATTRAQAVQAGRLGNTGAGTITAFSTPPSQPDVTVTNPQPAAGGADTESDADLRARARDFFRTARRGTLAAIEFGALTVPGVSRASVEEVVDSSGTPTGTVNCYIADRDGRANQPLVDAVVIALREYRAAGIPVLVVAGVLQVVDITYKVAFDASADTVSAVDQIKTATVAALEALRPGDTLRLSLLLSVLRSVPGTIVPQDAVQIPAGDLVPSAPQNVLRTEVARITVTS